MRRVLPFDQRQRYEVVTALAGALDRRCDILDVGGFYREIDGEACLPIKDAVPSARSVVIDLEPCNLASYARADAARLPFADASFDIVSCLDVIEHVPRPHRATVVTELVRVCRGYIIIGVPVADDGAAAREAALQEFIRTHLGGEQQQLREHVEFKLPTHTEMRSLLPRKTRTFGYGNLDRWAVLMFGKHYLLGMPHNLAAFHALDEGYGRLDAAGDRQPPFYRRFYLSPGRPAVSMAPLNAVARRYQPAPDRVASSGTDDAITLVFDTLLRREPERLAAERKPLEDRVGLLDGVIDGLKEHISHLDGVIGDLKSHIARVERTLAESQDHNVNLQTIVDENKAHIATLRADLDRTVTESQTHIHNLEAQIAHLEDAAVVLRDRVLVLEPLERETPDLRRAVAELRQLLNQVEQSKVYRIYRLAQKITGKSSPS